MVGVSSGRLCGAAMFTPRVMDVEVESGGRVAEFFLDADLIDRVTGESLDAALLAGQPQYTGKGLLLEDAWAADNGISGDPGKFPEIKAAIEGSEGALWLDFYPDADEYGTDGLDGLVSFNGSTVFGLFFSAAGALSGGFFDTGFLTLDFDYEENVKVRAGVCWKDGDAWLHINGNNGSVKAYTVGNLTELVLHKVNDRPIVYNRLGFSSVAKVPSL